jgi:Cys-tRNA(Pro) deacylase
MQTSDGLEPAQRFRSALEALGIDADVREFEASTSTAEAAAAAIGCATGQIVKSLFFMADGRPTLALVAGDRQVDTARLASLLGVGRKKLKMGSPEEVAAITGYEVGGVAPIGSRQPCDVVADESLRRFATVWAAAGTGHSVFEIAVATLAEVAGAQWAAITRDER